MLMQNNINKNEFTRIIIVFFSLYCLLLLTTLFFGKYYTHLMLPLYNWEISKLEPQFIIQSLDVESKNNTKILLTINLNEPIIINNKFFPKHTNITSSTLAAHPLQRLVITLSIFITWCIIYFKQWRLILGVVFPALIVIEMLDIPLLLLGSIWDLLYTNAGAEYYIHSWLIKWVAFLESGGRLFLNISAALTCMAFCKFYKKP